MIVVLPTVITMCGPIVVRRLVTTDRVAANNEVAGFKFATLGVVYLALGLVMLVATVVVSAVAL